MKFQDILGTIGNTPMIKINRLFGNEVETWMKIERSNPGGSIKDRIAFSMILDAENRKMLRPDSVVIEPTSGNTGIGLAMVCAVKGYRLILVMPESMSIERRRLMALYGAEFVLTPREKGMKGAIEKARELAKEIPQSWVPSQFENKVNVSVHKNTTAQEILNDFPEGFEYMVTGVGTGGHITGVGEALKTKFPGIKIFAVEPELSPILSGGSPGLHPIQGIGAGFVPAILNTAVYDRIIKINKEEAFLFTQLLAKEEGILAGISTGASLAAIAKIADGIPSGSRILTFNYDTGERYLSVEGLFFS